MISSLGFAMALQFKPDGRGGWVYRKDQLGAPLPVTAEERERHIRRYGWIALSALPLFMGLVIVFAIVADAIYPDPSNNQGAAIALVGMVIVGGLTYGYLKWFSHAPVRAFADRTPVGPAQTRKQVFGKRMGRFGYGRLWAIIAGMVVIGLFAGREEPGAWWLPLALFVPIGLAFSYWKWSIEREPG